MTIHVAHVITKLDVGGAQTHVVELARGQRRAGARVDVVSGVDGPAADRLRAAGVDVAIVPALGASHGRFSQRAAVAAVRAALSRIQPDIVHGHSSNAGLAARLAARRLGLPSVYTAHGWPFQRGAPWRQRVLSLVGECYGGRVGDAVIVLTQAELERARRARVTAPARLWVVPNGIADVGPDGRRPPGVPAGAPVLVMVARFAPPKLQAELIEVLTGLAEAPWALRLVGDGPQLAACEQLVASRPQLAGKVEFLGHRDDVAGVLAGCDIGVLWSRYEGLPISVLEYMRAGLCCVGSDLPGIRGLLAAGEAGVVAGSADELQRELLGLLADGDAIAARGAAARRRYEDHYSAAAMVTATDAVYRAVVAAGPRRRLIRRATTRG